MYADAIAALCRQHRIMVIVPTCEETFYLSAIAPSLAADAGICVFSPPMETLELLHHKFTFARFADSLGLSVPETLPLTDPIPICDGVLKRTYSRFGEQVVRLSAGDALPAKIASDSKPWIWQHWITGRSVSSYSLCADGKVLAHVAYQTPYVLAGGAGVYYESIDGTTSLSVAARLAEATAYTGQLSLDFIEDRDGVLWLIECNPRATMGLCLLEREPLFAEIFCKALLGQKTTLAAKTLVAAPGRATQLRLATLLWGRNRAADRSPEQWIKDVLCAPDVLSDGKEPRLLWGQVRVLNANRKQAWAVGYSLPAFTTRDIEWNGMEDARAATAARSRPPLLEQFPELTERFPWTQLLVSKASPVESVAKLSLLGDADVWLKRDDLVCSQYGGNKARKFEWILGDLRAKGYRELWTVGGLCSNHCTAAAVYGQKAGVAVRNFFVPTPLDEPERNLLRVQGALGASLAMLPPRLADLLRLLNPTTGASYLVPPGGSSVAGVLGYVDAGLEFCAQAERGDCPRPEVLYIAAASQGTVLGLAMGLRLGGMDPMPCIVAVETTTPNWQKARLFLPTPALALRRLRAASPALRRLLPNQLSAFAIESDKRFESLPLGFVNKPITDALSEAPDEAGLRLDAHYSARAYAALRQDLAAGLLKGKTVLFWQTHGSMPEEKVAELLRTAPPLPADVARAAARHLREIDEVIG